MSQNTSSAVMQQRREAPDSLDFYPTPPWATRALVRHVLGPETVAGRSAWEPACGEGHMAEVLRESFACVHASDVHDYGRGYDLGTFVGEGPDRASCPFRPDWIVSNPPFNLAADFVQRALGEAREGVAMLLRTAWVEGGERWSEIFRPRPPSTIAVFVERVPMVKGRWDPAGSSATSYAWFVWRQPLQAETAFVWIPPGQRKALHQAEDVRRFAVPSPTTEAPGLFAA